MKKVIKLTESDLMRIVKRVIKENEMMTGKTPQGAEKPLWKNFVSTLKTLSYPPKVLTWTNYGDKYQMQSLNWGRAKTGKVGVYSLAILATDSEVPNEEMELFNTDNRNQQKQMHAWWVKKGYKSNGNTVFISFANADKLKSDLEEFFKLFPPQ